MSQAPSITDDTFEQEVLKSDIPVLVDFWAEWCQPCKMVDPIIDEVGQEFADRVKVVKMNVDENTETPGTFGIMSIPTIMIFKNGEAKETLVGVKPKEAFKQSLDKVLASS